MSSAAGEADDMPTIDPKRIEIRPVRSKIEGVNDKAAGMVEGMLQKGRRYFGSSGALLTHQIHSPEYQEKGVDKEAAKEVLKKVRKTTDFLREWVADKPNVVLVDSVRTHNWGEPKVNEDTGLVSGGYNDHVLIFGSEVVILDTRDYGKKKVFTVGTEGEILRSKKGFPGNENTMDRMIQHWLNYLEAGAALTGIIYLPGEENSVFRNRNWYMQSFRIVEEDRFEALLNEKWKSVEDRERHEIDPTLISQVVVESIKPYDEFSKVLTDKALSEFKK